MSDGDSPGQGGPTGPAANGGAFRFAQAAPLVGPGTLAPLRPAGAPAAAPPPQTDRTTPVPAEAAGQAAAMPFAAPTPSPAGPGAPAPPAYVGNYAEVPAVQVAPAYAPPPAQAASPAPAYAGNYAQQPSVQIAPAYAATPVPVSPHAQMPAAAPAQGTAESPWMVGQRLDAANLPSAQFLAKPEPPDSARTAPKAPVKPPRSNTMVIVLAVLAGAAVLTLGALALRRAGSSSDPISINVKDNGTKAPEDAPTASASAETAPSAPKHFGKLPTKPVEDIYDDVDKPKPPPKAPPTPLPPSLKNPGF